MRLIGVIRLLLSFILLFSVGGLLPAQSAGPDTPLPLSNPSFEDVPRQNHSPTGWFDCGFSGESPVDVHPQTLIFPDSGGYFKVNAPAFDGNTYVGMVVRDNDTYEAISQRIIGGPLKAGKCYTFSIYMSRSEKYVSISKTTSKEENYITPAKLRIWGGFSYCNRGEVLAESAPVTKTEWLQYNFRFEPKKDHAFIVLEAYYKTPVLFPYNGNILLDMAGKIVPVPCDNDLPPEADPPVVKVEPEVEEPIVASNTPSRPRTPVAPPQATRVEPKKKDATLAGKRLSELSAGSVLRVEKLFFKADSSAITPQSQETLDEIYDFLSQYENVVIEVGGHTSGGPTHEYCDWLSTERATSVVDALAKKGIDRRRLVPKGYG